MRGVRLTWGVCTSTIVASSVGVAMMKIYFEIKLRSGEVF